MTVFSLAERTLTLCYTGKRRHIFTHQFLRNDYANGRKALAYICLQVVPAHLERRAEQSSTKLHTALPLVYMSSFALPHKTVVSLISYTVCYLHRFHFIRPQSFKVALCYMFSGVQTEINWCHLKCTTITIDQLIYLKYQQGTATHLSTAQKQALQGGGLYTNQALGEMMFSEHSFKKILKRCDCW